MVASKLGAALALAKLATAMGASIQSLLMGIGIATIAFAVVASFAQTDLRRLLAYSAVAHAGFLALGASCGVAGASATKFYIVGYGAAALLCFAAVAGTGTEGFPITALGPGPQGKGGLGRGRSLALLLGLLSLAGIPPTPGFFVKLAVLRATYEQWGTVPTLLAALGGVVGVIYYLRPMPDLLASTTTSEAKQTGVASALWVLVVLALGFAPTLAWFLAQ
jgi:NADH-quinone oxidoreductase subunit N